MYISHKIQACQHSSVPFLGAVFGVVLAGGALVARHLKNIKPNKVWFSFLVRKKLHLIKINIVVKIGYENL